MALTVNQRHYMDTSSMMSTYSNYSSHRKNDLLLPLPSKSSTVDMMSLSKHSWFDLTSDSSTKTIKDETYDFDISEISSLPTNDIDYTIIDSGIDPLQTKTHSTRASLEKSSIRKKKPGPAKRKLNDSFLF